MPIGVLGFARGSPNPNHWFSVVADPDTSGGLFIHQGWDGVDVHGRCFEFDDWVESADRLVPFFGRLPWRIDWLGSAQQDAAADDRPQAGDRDSRS